MRVLHVLHNSVPLICGYSIRSRYILENQRRFGLDVAAVTSAQQPTAVGSVDVIDRVPYFRTPLPRNNSLPVVREMRLMRALEHRIEEVLSQAHPDIMHAHSPVLVGLPALRAARRHGLPFVYEIRDLWENASVDRGKFREGSPTYRAARALESYVLRNADSVVAICETMRCALAPRIGDKKHVSVVANGVDLEAFDPRDSGSGRERWNLHGKTVVGYVGTFQPYEGLRLLIQAVSEVRKTLPTVHLLIVGGSASPALPGEQRPREEAELLSLVRELGLGESVTFTGRIPHADVREAYSACNLLVYPRLLTRTTALTTPLKPLEAMAMRKAVLVSDIPAMRELVRPGVTGEVFRAGDVSHLSERISHLLSSADKCDALGLASRRWIESERQWCRLVARYAEIYSRVGVSTAVA